MSSYLLLRNNKESGPFSLEELESMSLKEYDLIWIVGKSAAWRYPGEITELKSFAPPIPDPFGIAAMHRASERNAMEASKTRRTEQASRPELSSSMVSDHPAKIISTQPSSVYVNLPAEKKTNVSKDRIIFDQETTVPSEKDPSFQGDLFEKKSPPRRRMAGKIFWAFSLGFLFGAGVLTGFFISDRRNFFTKQEKNIPSVSEPPAVNVKQEEELHTTSNEIRPASFNGQAPLNTDSLKQLKKTVLKSPRKNSNPVAEKKKDTVVGEIPVQNTISAADSLRQLEMQKIALLNQKIKSHPENYVSLVAGHYTSGLFGGISSFPVTVTNNSAAILDQVTVTVDYVQNNDKVYKSENIQYNNLEPGETVTLKAPKSSRGTKINIRILDVTPRLSEPVVSHLGP